MIIYTKESLIEALRAISERGFIKNENRRGNDGAIGNLLEDLLGIEENNLPLPNAAEWELKTSRTGTTALTTLLHNEPSPRGLKLVPNILLPIYGWAHKAAGTKYSINEMSFRQTIRATNYSNRGFTVDFDDHQEKIVVSFDATKADTDNHVVAEWLAGINSKVGLGEIDPQPYWGYRDIFHAMGQKLKNAFYVEAARKKIEDDYYFHYNKITILSNFSSEKLLTIFKDGRIYVDFDARTGHNHGTKFRIRQNYFPLLYDNAQIVFTAE